MPPTSLRLVELLLVIKDETTGQEQIFEPKFISHALRSRPLRDSLAFAAGDVEDEAFGCIFLPKGLAGNFYRKSSKIFRPGAVQPIREVELS